MTTKWNNQIYLFAMNGQTGKFVGNLPTDMSAFFKWFAGIAGAVAAICLLVMWLMWLM